jgi:cytochrome P450
MTKTIIANGVEIREGDLIYIGMNALCHDREQWQQPYDFIPERFDPQSKWYLTPSGHKRNPFSFSPFLGG